MLLDECGAKTGTASIAAVSTPLEYAGTDNISESPISDGGLTAANEGPFSWNTTSFHNNLGIIQAGRYRHSSGTAANYLFADGHVKFLRPEKLTNTVTPDQVGAASYTGTYLTR